MRFCNYLIGGLLVLLIALGPGMAQTVLDEFSQNNRTYKKTQQGWFLYQDQAPTFRVVPNTISLKLKPLNPLQQQAFLQDRNADVLRVAKTGYMDLAVPQGQDVVAYLRSFLDTPEVVVAELSTYGSYGVIPNDNLYGDQWHHPIIESTAAWDMTTGITDVIVAILDSGTEFSHEDLGTGPDAYQNVWLNPEEDPWSDPNDPSTGDGVDGGNGYIDDWKGWDFDLGNNDPSSTNSHGTNVAGTVAAKTNNNLGVAGVAGGFGNEGAKLMLCGVGVAGPNGSVLDDAILYAAENGARVIQMSLTVGQSGAIDAALEMAYNTYGVLIVCASGNGGSSSVGYPSSNQHVMAVGATNQSDTRVGFSQHGENLEISAPGVDITYTTLNNNYSSGSGTSFAAPIVSGVAALAFSLSPALSNAEVRQLLLDTADKVGGYNYNWNAGMPGHSFELGYGRVNARAVVEAAIAVDLLVKDSPDDLGLEPNLQSQGRVWNSNDIWNCVDDPDCTQHQDPVFGAMNYVRTRVTNRGNVQSPTADLHLYWSRARTGSLWPDHWLDPADPANPGNNTPGAPGGARITADGGFNPDPVPIPALNGQQSMVFTRTWQPPDPASFPMDTEAGEPMVGLLARIESNTDVMALENDGPVGANVLNNNNIASRNTTITSLGLTTLSGELNTANLHNIGGSSADLDLVLEPSHPADAAYPGAVELVLSDDLWNAWVGAGQQSSGFMVSADNYLSLTNPAAGGRLEGIPLSADAWMSLGVRFSMDGDTAVAQDGTNYNFTLAQFLAGGNDEIGAVTFTAELFQPYAQLIDGWPETGTILKILNRQPIPE